MILNIILFLTALICTLYGANRLVDGACSLAKKLKISELVIGCTIVALGTSLPEMVVSFTGSIMHNADIALGNILGSNIYNMAFILGCSAIINPINISKEVKVKESRFNLIANLAFVFALYSGFFNPVFGIGMLFCYALYIYGCTVYDSNNIHEEETKILSTKRTIIYIIIGLISILIGGKVFVSSGIAIAQKLGISDAKIAIIAMALGTSLPELITSIVASCKKHGDLVLGNVFGSNIANVFLIVGGSCCIHNLMPIGISSFDMISLLIITVIVSIMMCFNKLNRLCGVILISLSLLYFINL